MTSGTTPAFKASTVRFGDYAPCRRTADSRLTFAPVARICADPVAQVRVAVADVNLSNPQGIATVYARLRRAAGDVCGSEPQYRELERHTAWSKCVRVALDGAVVQVHSIGLAELHATHFGGRSLLLATRGTPEER